MAAFIFPVIAAHGSEMAYWVWQREDPLNENELRELAAQNVHLIYWHVGELENVGPAWHWRARFHFPEIDQSAIRYVPVVRLISHEQQPFSNKSLGALVNALSLLTVKHDELQLDYDAPDRLVHDYATALKRIHQLVARLSITALPRWGRPDYLKQLQSSVDELLPMLYDFEPEPALKGNSTSPLIDPEKMMAMLTDWSACQSPWRAGLPTFARLTVYDANGKSRGQIRNWNWDELCNSTALARDDVSHLGTTILRVIRPTAISNTPLGPGERLAARWVDRLALRDAIARVGQTNARGIVFFRLPDSTAASGWSLPQLQHLEAKPQLMVRKLESSESLELQNRGNGDLEPWFQTEHGGGGGYSLDLEAPAPIFREAEPGDFSKFFSCRETAKTLKAVPIPFATRMTFTFSQLRAGQSLRTGLIQLAPGTNFHQIHYQIRNIEGGPSWQTIE